MNESRKNLGGRLIAMPYAQRIDLMKAIVFRRLDEGIKITRPQLELGLRYDDEEIKKYVGGWDATDYLGMPFFEFFAKHMVEAGLVKETPVEGKKYSAVEQTQAGRDWLKTLDDDFTWFVEIMPMSTRGLFDNYRDEPENTINMTPEELADQVASDPSKHIAGSYDPKQLLKGKGFNYKPKKGEKDEFTS